MAHVKVCTADTCSCVRQGYECAREVYEADNEVYGAEDEVYTTRGITCPHCGCNSLCQNRSLQLLNESRVRLEECGPNHSLTLVTCQSVPPHAALIEWRGVVKVDMCHSMTGVSCPARASQHVYHCLRDQLVIDSTIFGNESRFIRRTRDAQSVNCALVETFIGEELHVTAVSTCHIEADTPLYLSEDQFERNKFQQSHGRSMISIEELSQELQSILVDLEKFRTSEPEINTDDGIIGVDDEDETVHSENAPVQGVAPSPTQRKFCLQILTDN